MIPEMIRREATHVVGMHTTLCMARDTTRDLWRGFMSRRAELTQRCDDMLYSINDFSGVDFSAFGPEVPFVKWAAAAVAPDASVPEGMAHRVLPGGLYAVFTHRGPASAAPRIMNHIYGVWLPASGYALDVRPHFEILPPGYAPDDPHAEETLWIPVRPKP